MSTSLKWSKLGAEPRVAIDVLAVNDIYRLARHLQHGQCDFYDLGTQMLAKLRADGGEEWFARVCRFFGDDPGPAPGPEDFL